jgi:uncharacterized protein (DUF983 family)
MQPVPRPTGAAITGRALRLKCPRCGGAPMFSGLFQMHERCAHCELKFEREPGYFLGSIYFNYGISALIITVTWVVLRFGYDVPAKQLLAGLLVFLIVFQVLFFRYARALWLAMDCRLDPALYAPSPAAPTEHTTPSR